jgi:ribosomal-protein-alanine N-acetyltransferase
LVNQDLTEETLFKDYETDKPILETDRLIIRTLNEADVPELKEWLGS